ncbi:RNA ligase family protein, partial [Kitasatospora sp. NPDC007106]|uniref:RNA ligase family protein n=1 Tax=Kitasatospora sp. NPDC007106 TaxID=3156914 RepID=UPI00340BF31E
MRVSYPRTPHLPWSPGASADDVRAGGLDGLRGREVVVTEKLDGENTTLYRDGLHARSLDSGHHPSRAWVKALQGRIGPAVPAGWRVCGENLFARHSLAYRELDSWFYGFSVWDDTDHCLGWDDTVRFLRRLGVPAPRVLWRGVLDEKALRALRFDTERVEGYVVRTAEGFPRAEFGQRVAKWVRPHHVRTDTHWMHAAVVENGLGPAAALWAVRSGAPADLPALLGAAGLDPERAPAAEAAAAEVSARLDVLGRRPRRVGADAGEHRVQAAGRVLGVGEFVRRRDDRAEGQPVGGGQDPPVEDRRECGAGPGEEPGQPPVRPGDADREDGERLAQALQALDARQRRPAGVRAHRLRQTRRCLERQRRITRRQLPQPVLDLPFGLRGQDLDLEGHAPVVGPRERRLPAVGRHAAAEVPCPDRAGSAGPAAGGTSVPGG